MKKNKDMFLNIKKANEILINKLVELKDYFNSNKSAFNMGEKEINKYYKLKDNEKALGFKTEYDKKAEALKLKLDFTVENLKNEGVQRFFTDLINYYAKVEDGYYDILNTSKNSEMSAGTFFKCEVMIDYYVSNLKNINELESKLYKKLENLDEKEF